MKSPSESQSDRVVDNFTLGHSSTDRLTNRLGCCAWTCKLNCWREDSSSVIICVYNHVHLHNLRMRVHVTLYPVCPLSLSNEPLISGTLCILFSFHIPFRVPAFRLSQLPVWLLVCAIAWPNHSPQISNENMLNIASTAIYGQLSKSESKELLLDCSIGMKQSVHGCKPYHDGLWKQASYSSKTLQNMMADFFSSWSP